MAVKMASCCLKISVTFPFAKPRKGFQPHTLNDLYRKAIDQLVRLQVEGTQRGDESCIAFQQAFDHRLFMWEFEHFIEWGFEKREGKPLSAAEGKELRAMFNEISTRLDQAPRFLNHRDYHSWNLFVQNGEIRVIDFQDALLAPATYDLETLLNDRDTPTVISPVLEQTLVNYYHIAWHEQWRMHRSHMNRCGRSTTCAFTKGQ